MTFWVLFSYLIPISLFVTMELVRVGQAIFIEFDDELCTDVTDRANNSAKVCNCFVCPQPLFALKLNPGPPD